MKKIFLLLVGLLCLYGVRAQDLVILHLNDFHSQIEPFRQGRNAGYGGCLAISDYVSRVRAQHPQVLLLDAGDYNQGTPYFNLFKGDMEVALHNALGMDVATLGNHEFDNGITELVRRLRMARYKTVCANLRFHDRAMRKLVKPFVILRKGSHKIGIYGITCNLKGLICGETLDRMEYKDPIPVANSIAARLRRKGCDLVICLSHQGVQEDQAMAAGLIGTDMIVGGHSHTFLKEPIMVPDATGKEIPVVQTGCKGVYVGRFDVNF